MKLFNLVVLTSTILLSGQVTARGLSPITILNCTDAKVTIGRDYQYTGSIYQRIDFSDKVIKELLTQGQNEVVNRGFLIGPNHNYGINPNIDLNRDVELATYILKVNGIETSTLSPVNNADNYFGSMTEINQGKQVRLVRDFKTRSLQLFFHDVDSDKDLISKTFINCH